METLKELVKGTATMDCVRTGGIAEYIITSCNGKKYMLEINLADKVDCGESASFNGGDGEYLSMAFNICRDPHMAFHFP